jgi:hypothetical protein
MLTMINVSKPLMVRFKRVIKKFPEHEAILVQFELADNPTADHYYRLISKEFHAYMYDRIEPIADCPEELSRYTAECNFVTVHFKNESFVNNVQTSLNEIDEQKRIMEKFDKDMTEAFAMTEAAIRANTEPPESVEEIDFDEFRVKPLYDTPSDELCDCDQHECKDCPVLSCNHNPRHID